MKYSIHNKIHYFSLNSFVYVAIGKLDAMLFNTLNNDFLETKEKNNIDLLKKIQSDIVTNVMELSYEEFKKNEIFIISILKKFMGSLIEKNNEIKPIQINPKMGLKKKDNLYDLSYENNIISYLGELNVYLNMECNLECNICKTAVKQFLFCTKNLGVQEELEFNILMKIINSLKRNEETKINILGGNILLYSKFFDMINYLKEFRNLKNFFINYKNILNLKDASLLSLLFDQNIFIEILIPLNFDEIEIIKTINILKRFNLNYAINFTVSNKIEKDKILKIISKKTIELFRIRPYYSKNNIRFFEDNIFFTKKDLMNRRYSTDDIKRNEVINTNFFGVLNINNAGSIYTNLSTKAIGNINDLSLDEVISFELKKKKNWFFTRDKVKPCKNCIFKFLCPSISTYEYEAKKYNFCKIKGEEK